MGGRRPGAGRPKGARNKVTADVMAAAQVYTTEALKTLAYLMRNAEAEAARVAACREILDRAHGKPAQTVDTTITDNRLVAAPLEKARDNDEWLARNRPH